MWVDAATGVLGSLVIAIWSVGLLRQSAAVLLDAERAGAVRAEVCAALESDGHTRIVDLHLWSIGVGRMAALIAVVSTDPKPPSHYRARLKSVEGLVHITVEVNPA